MKPTIPHQTRHTCTTGNGSPMCPACVEKGFHPPMHPCNDPWCPDHALCGACGTHVIILDADDPAFCPSCEHDVMPKGACAVANTAVTA